MICYEKSIKAKKIKIIMRFIKTILKIVTGFVLSIIVLLAFMLAQLNDIPYKQMPYYKEWKGNLKKLTTKTGGVGQLKTGWAKVSFTPQSPTPTAGYGVRQGKLYTSVHDSVYVRAIVIDNGTTKAAIVSADLLIVPPTVVERLKEKLAKGTIPFANVYLGATHSHNSVGGWGDTFTGELFAGKFNPDNVDRIAEAISKAIQLADSQLKPTQMGYCEVSDTVHVRNRSFDGGTTDPMIRNIEFLRNDGQKAIICTYSAHSTIINSETIVLSRDYPGVLVDSLERNEANFALFMSGAVGSMGPKEVGNNDFERVNNEADGIENMLEPALPKVKFTNDNTVQMLTIPLPMREPNARVLFGWRLRPWIFNWAFGQFDCYVKALRLGNVLMVGVPCDFSGELMPELTNYAKQKGLNLIVTSFNGGYAGYITPDKNYNIDNYETQTMNWFGPYNGAYFQEVISDLVDLMKS
jgi:neutral ceramidase